MYKKFGLSISVLLVSLLIVPLVHAQSGSVSGYPLNPTRKDSPTWFVYNLDLGRSIEDTLVVLNDSNEDWLINVYPVDSGITAQGAFAAKGRNEPKVEMGAWIDISEGEFILEAGKEKLVPFTLTIPKTADIGETSGAIMIEKFDPKKKEGSNSEGGIEITVRVGSRVYNTVPGNITEKFAISSLDTTLLSDKKTYNISFAASNLGNISSDGKYAISIKSWPFKKYNQEIVSEIFLKRGTILSITKSVAEYPLFGKITVDLDLFLKDQNGKETLQDSKSTSSWIIPWRYILLFLLIGIILTIAKLLYERKFSSDGWIEYEIQPGNTITGLADFFGINWKVLAKVNKLKAPYILTTGQKLLVPPDSAEKFPHVFPHLHQANTTQNEEQGNHNEDL